MLRPRRRSAGEPGSPTVVRSMATAAAHAATVRRDRTARPGVACGSVAARVCGAQGRTVTRHHPTGEANRQHQCRPEQSAIDRERVGGPQQSRPRRRARSGDAQLRRPCPVEPSSEETCDEKPDQERPSGRHDRDSGRRAEHATGPVANCATEEGADNDRHRTEPHTPAKAGSAAHVHSPNGRRGLADPTTRRYGDPMAGPNRLAHETSPYLRQHADNPVDWYPWGDEAFAAARGEDVPVLLSVGYSACHWCHVMAHESLRGRRRPPAVMNEPVRQREGRPRGAARRRRRLHGGRPGDDRPAAAGR